ncbi:MAG: hypothetical protein MZV49_07870 [Rhodopseudomonas palustris]|nr:hypothetical protein [Rhodopseudomonas palustris]
MDDLIRSLTALRASLIDARSGYQEGLKDAHGQGLTPLFTELIAQHDQDAAAIAAGYGALVRRPARAVPIWACSIAR